MTAVLPDRDVTVSASEVPAHEVPAVLSRSILADGFDFVLDTEQSRGSYLVDARTGDRYLDMFTFFASSALGDEPSGADGPPGVARRTGRHRGQQAEQLRYLHRHHGPVRRYVHQGARRPGTAAPVLHRRGGALAVENALKVAFDWKSRRNESRGGLAAPGSRVLHLRGAFHGRSGYTMSLTNTDPNKVARFPKFDWPRIDAPYLRPGVDPVALEAESLRQARAAFEAYPDDIACFIAEPIQARAVIGISAPEFFAAMRALCDEFDALLIFDEVQTGCGMTGTAWAYQQLGVRPDVVAFGKKTQVCGLMAGGRVDDVPDNVFAVSSRINSTWGWQPHRYGPVPAHPGGHRSRRPDAQRKGARRPPAGPLARRGIRVPPALVRDPRGRGLMCAFSMPSGAARDELVNRLWDRHVIMLPSGVDSVRFRPALTVSRDELDAAVDAVRAVLNTL